MQPLQEEVETLRKERNAATTGGGRDLEEGVGCSHYRSR
jgi:hypothetical protein